MKEGCQLATTATLGIFLHLLMFMTNVPNAAVGCIVSLFRRVGARPLGSSLVPFIKVRNNFTVAWGNFWLFF
ncbi:hypothetical protein PUN28_018792 [Cardiocondyla obscurior]|uniref:Uncharacterized protein n=1 Tax=Cardiocondyla obscurior TaxID=286306 RepID=A0AAW2EFN5_9HYME